MTLSGLWLKSGLWLGVLGVVLVELVVIVAEPLVVTRRRGSPFPRLAAASLVLGSTWGGLTADSLEWLVAVWTLLPLHTGGTDVPVVLGGSPAVISGKARWGGLGIRIASWGSVVLGGRVTRLGSFGLAPNSSPDGCPLASGGVNPLPPIRIESLPISSKSIPSPSPSAARGWSGTSRGPSTCLSALVSSCWWSSCTPAPGLGPPSNA